MSVVPFEPRKTVNERLRDHLTESEEALKASIHNGNVNRVRLDRVEALLSRGFFGRLRWLVRGE